MAKPIQYCKVKIIIIIIIKKLKKMQSMFSKCFDGLVGKTDM